MTGFGCNCLHASHMSLYIAIRARRFSQPDYRCSTTFHPPMQICHHTGLQSHCTVMYTLRGNAAIATIVGVHLIGLKSSYWAHTAQKLAAGPQMKPVP